ncbi:outer membrane lipoprotein-sorting protein [Ideonella sp. A 288]|uniref:outer membrane lipoprotein-sorting protein n=1 Tax=Ideonella sp. A 288 TaxID=1962181 RepID=UPI0038559614
MRSLFLAALVFVHLAASAAPDAQELLRASDAIRNPGRPFAVKVTLAEFEAGKQVDASTLMTYSRAQDNNGQFASLVSFVLPARDAGKLMLRNGDDLWFYDPSTKASVRLSPQQRLLGQASNGDVITVNLAKDYSAKLLAEEDVTDGERKTRKSYKLGLTATSNSATYTTIEYWVDAENNRPIKGRFFAESGRLLKTVYYRRYQAQLGRERPTETVIIDGLNPQSVTLMRFTDFAMPAIPQTWFHRDHLPRFQPE